MIAQERLRPNQNSQTEEAILYLLGRFKVTLRPGLYSLETDWTVDTSIQFSNDVSIT